MTDVSDELFERIALRLRAMANPTRLKILHTLEEGQLSVSEIVDRTGTSQANVSKQLGLLRGAALVDSRRQGVSVYYRISDPMVFDICRTVCNSLLDRASLEVETLEVGRDAMFTGRS